MNNITLNLDKTTFENKPQKGEIAAIQKRLAVAKTTVTVEELANYLNNGCTMKSGALNGNSNQDWVSQDVFALDFDNDAKTVEKYGYINIEQVLLRCKMYNIKAAFYYTTFSHSEEKDKFRVVFIIDKTITDIRVRAVVQLALMNIFPESDKACKDLSRVFFGSKKGAVEINYENTINVADIVEALVVYIKVNETSSTASKKINDYCKNVSLNMYNNLPDIKKVEDTKIGPNTANSILYIIELALNGPKIALNFNVAEEDFILKSYNNKGEAKKAKFDINKTKEAKKLTRSFDFEALKQNCELYRKFINGEYWGEHEEVMHIAQNI